MDPVQTSGGGSQSQVISLQERMERAVKAALTECVPTSTSSHVCHCGRIKSDGAEHCCQTALGAAVSEKRWPLNTSETTQHTTQKTFFWKD